MGWEHLKTAVEWFLPVVLLVLWFSPTDWIIGWLFRRDDEPIVQLGISQAKRK